MKIFYSEMLNKAHDLSQRIRHIIPFIGYPLNRNENFRPFFIIGSGRSGNTLLRRILHSGKSIFIPPESYVLGRVIKLFRQNKNLPWRNLVYVVLSQFEFHHEFPTFGISLRPLVQRLVDLPKDKRSLAYILNSFYNYYAEEKKISGKRWGDKTPINTLHLERIYAVFPNAQFIHMIRDGCDVVCSYVESGIYPSIDEAAKRWLISVKLGQRFGAKHPNNYLEVRYENLVKNPANTIAEICDFLDMDFSRGMINSEHIADELGDVVQREHHSNVFKPISALSIDRGRKKLSVEEKEVLQKIIGKELLSLGYESCLP